MERLTKIINGGVVYFGPEHEPLQGSLPIEMNSRQVRDVLQKLAAYEDTGLTPAEALSMKMDMAIVNAMFQGTEVKRMKELAKADKDGRLVVLPCKVGDTVFLVVDDGRRVCECEVRYFSFSGDGCAAVAVDKVTGWEYGAMSHSFGKTIFLTREEAEAALKEAAHDEL